MTADAAKPRQPTATSLENAALFYLSRFDASTASLVRVLDRRVRRAARADPEGADPDASARLIADVVEKMRRLGYLDDTRYAANRARGLLARGTAPGRIRLDLAAKGVAADDIDAALSALAADGGEGPLPLKAAVALVRRRRLGPYRAGAERAIRRTRDLAALARAGFDLAIARRVIDAETPESLERMLVNAEA